MNLLLVFNIGWLFQNQLQKRLFRNKMNSAVFFFSVPPSHHNIFFRGIQHISIGLHRHFACVILSCFPNIPRLRIVVDTSMHAYILYYDIIQYIANESTPMHSVVTTKNSTFSKQQRLATLRYAFDGSAPPLLLLALDALSGLSPRTASRYLLK